MGVDLGPMPTIHPWMLAPHNPVLAAAEMFWGVAGDVDFAGRKLQEVLGEAGGVMGWRSTGAESARVPLVQANTEVGMLRDVAIRARSALHSLAMSMSQYGPELTKLKTRREELTWQASLVNDESGQDTKEINALIEDAGRVDRQIRHGVEMLATADRQARDELERVADDLTTLGSIDREDDWVGDMAPPEVIGLLGRYGITESAAERALLDQIMLLPTGADGDKELRRLLGEMTPEELADFLLRHPDVARRLAGPLDNPGAYPPGSPEALLATAIAAGKGLPPKEAIAAVRSAFAAMSPAEQQRLALLYPGVVGNLNGAPLDLRIAANRVQIGVALDDERGRRVDTSRAMAARTDREKWWGEKNNEDMIKGIIADLDDPDSEQYRNNKRIDYYQQLLYDEVDQPGRTGPRLDEKDNPTGHHQVLYFDPTGDGQIAEMWGTIGPDTRNVAVYVPGTSADLENFGSNSEKMRRMAAMDPSGQTVTIAWMGTNLPDALVANAANNKYAEDGGPKFRDFVWGLDIPPEKRVTAIGHSYGGAVVGVADREGLEVDAVVHLASAGLGRGVETAADYPDGVDGKERYAITSPGDPIGYFQGRDYFENAGLGHGGDPDSTPGVTRLESGRYLEGEVEDGGYAKKEKRGQMLEGGDAHDAASRPGTTAFDNLFGVVTGGEVTPYVPVPENGPAPYEDPGYNGPTVDIPDDAGR
jgi:pimeloyl-ACP methyl ester carboxylesterase